LGFGSFRAKKSLRLEIRPAVVVKEWRAIGVPAFAVAWLLLFGNLSFFSSESIVSRRILLASEIAAGGGSL
jgi:hypothetical protein